MQALELGRRIADRFKNSKTRTALLHDETAEQQYVVSLERHPKLAQVDFVRKIILRYKEFFKKSGKSGMLDKETAILLAEELRDGNKTPHAHEVGYLFLCLQLCSILSASGVINAVLEYPDLGRMWVWRLG